jgi:hypothetical protein
LIDDITCRSSECHCGSIFVAIKGEKADGPILSPKHIAAERGFYYRTSRSLPHDAVALVVDDSRARWRRLCGDFTAIRKKATDHRRYRHKRQIGQSYILLKKYSIIQDIKRS